MKLLSMEAYLMGRDKAYPLSAEQKANASRLLAKIHELQLVCPHAFEVRSGYRPSAINSRVAGAAPRSKHIDCLAVDIADPRGVIAQYLMANLHLLEKFELWMEHPDFTDSWVHLQDQPPASGRRVFRP